MTKYHVVTSFSDKLWDRYAARTVPSIVANLPEDVGVTVWYNGEFNEVWRKAMPTVTFKDLNAVGDYQYFRQRYKLVQPPKVEPGHAFRFNFLPFWNKVCALYQEVKAHSNATLIWIDADVVSQKKITMEDLDRWVGNADVSTLVRGEPWNTWDTGFLAVRLPHAYPLVKDVYDLYTSGRIFDQNEWHDAYLFTVVFKDYRDRLMLKNLNMMKAAAHPFDTSILPPQLMHLKGPERKIKGIAMDPSKANGVFRADFTGVRGVQEDVVYVLTEGGEIDQADNR